MYMLEISENMLDKGEYICAMFIKGLRHHGLLISKLRAFVFSQDALYEI